MRELVITWWPRGNATEPGERRSYSWQELCEWIAEHGAGPPHPKDPRGEDSVRHPCWSPAEYTGNRRSLATLERCHVVGLDFDDGAVSISELSDRLVGLCFGCLLYTTKSHTISKPALRVLFPLREPCNAMDYRRVRDWLNTELGGKADNAARDPSRFWWQPTSPLGRPEMFTAAPLDGRWVAASDVVVPLPAFELPEQPQPEPARPAASPPPTKKSEQNRNGAEHTESDPRVVRRANSLLGKLSGKVGTAAEGMRERTLNRAVALIAGKPDYVAVLGKEAILGTLVRAAVQAGLPEREARDKAVRAFEWGADRPLPPSNVERAEADRVTLKRGENGKPEKHVDNTLAVLEAKRYAGLFVYDAFAHRIRRTRGVPGAESRGPGPVVDDDLVAMRVHISRLYGFEPSKEHMLDAMSRVASSNEIHPVRDWLKALKWDGQARIDTLFSDSMGCRVGAAVSNTPERFALASRLLLLAAVKRVVEPGCKADVAVVMHGRQGVGKSTSVAALAGPEWFTDAHIDMRDKDGQMALQGRWLVELSELTAVRARENEIVKSFLSRTEDWFRPPYGALYIARPRQCLFVGTTNDLRPFDGKGGMRRYFSMVVTERADLHRLRFEREQIWAEAYARVMSGERWWLTAEEEDEASIVQETFAAGTGDEAWTEAIAAYLAAPTRDHVTVRSILIDALRFEPARISRADETRVGTIMREAFDDWVRTRVRGKDGRQVVYTRTAHFR